MNATTYRAFGWTEGQIAAHQAEPRIDPNPDQVLVMTRAFVTRHVHASDDALAAGIATLTEHGAHRRWSDRLIAAEAVVRAIDGPERAGGIMRRRALGRADVGGIGGTGAAAREAA